MGNRVTALSIQRSRRQAGRPLVHVMAGVFAVALSASLPSTAAEMPNACPVDGCLVSIVSVEKSGDELQVTLEANYTPDNARNHLHMWWGE